MPALSTFFGSERLSASPVRWLSEAWQDEWARRRRRSLAGTDYVYRWADGVHLGVRIEEDRLCCLVLVGVRPDRRKELGGRRGRLPRGHAAMDLPRSRSSRGRRVPELAVGDGRSALGAALREVFLITREQRRWVHRTAKAGEGWLLAPVPPRSGRPA